MEQTENNKLLEIDTLKNEYSYIEKTRGDENIALDSFTNKGQSLNIVENFGELFNKIAKILNIEYYVCSEPDKFGKYIKTPDKKAEIGELINNKRISEIREKRLEILRKYDEGVKAGKGYEAYVENYDEYFKCLDDLNNAYFDVILNFLT